MTDRLPPADRVARLRLARTRGIGPLTYRELVDRFGSAAAALDALPDLAGSGGRRLELASRAAAEDEIASVERFGGVHIFAGVAPYPALLAAVVDAPPVLTVRGRLDLFGRSAVAIVGARNASAAAVSFAHRLAAPLGEAGLVVVSGLARGIDTAAHQASLGSGTIAVVAGGADIVYPPENRRLQRLIGEQGLIVAEQPLGASPQARHFPRRNRIIAGLSLGTIVVEAAIRSGSLITARQAADYGREVMAIPGSPLDPRAQGANHLIREGATLVQCAADVLEALGPQSRPPRPGAIAPPRRDRPDPATARPEAISAAAPHRRRQREAEPARPGTDEAATADGEDQQLTTALLSRAPITVDELMRQSGLAPAALQAALLSLELAGRLERHAGGRVALAG